jgi:hypothetical protein
LLILQDEIDPCGPLHGRSVMNTIHTLIAAASLAALVAGPAVAQHHGGGGSHGGGGFHGGGGWHGGGGGGWHGGGGGWHGGSGWHGGGSRWHGGGWYGGRSYYGGRGWYAGDAFALGLFSGYAFGGPWAYDYYPAPYAYSYDYAPPPPPSYYDRAPSDAVYDGSDMPPADDGKHCPLYWNDKTGRYEPRCG